MGTVAVCPLCQIVGSKLLYFHIFIASTYLKQSVQVNLHVGSNFAFYFYSHLRSDAFILSTVKPRLTVRPLVRVTGLVGSGRVGLLDDPDRVEGLDRPLSCSGKVGGALPHVLMIVCTEAGRN